MLETETLSSGSVETLYHIAYMHYRQGKYGDAAGLFRFLTMHDIRNSKHWMGLGASLQMLRKYSEALQAYQLAASLNALDPRVHIYAADCFFALDYRKEGLDALACAEQAIKQQKTPDKNLLTHVSLMKTAWKPKKTSNKK